MKLWQLIVGIVVAAFFAIAFLMWFGPTYNVWSKGMNGQAHLKEADFTRQIAIVEAEAKKNAAAALGEAEVIRATKLAEANEILGKSLKNNDEYLKYLWITEVAAGQHQGDSQVIYLPGNDLLPFATNLETGRAVNNR